MMESRPRTRAVVLVVVWSAVIFLCAFPFLRPLIQADPTEDMLVFQRADLDGNGVIDAADITLAHAWFEFEAPLDCIEALDVINDGRLDSGDLYALYDIAGGGATFPETRILFTRGDLDDNGLIEHRDGRILTAFLRGQTSLDVPMDAADLNGDGYLDHRDEQAMALELEVQESELLAADGAHGSLGAALPDVLVVNGRVFVAEGAPLAEAPPIPDERQPLPPRLRIEDESALLRAPGVAAPAGAVETGTLVPAVNPAEPTPVIDGFEYVLDSTGMDYDHDGKKGIQFRPGPLPSRIVVLGRSYMEHPGERGLPPTRVIDGPEYNPDSGALRTPVKVKPVERPTNLPPRILICGNVYALRSPGIQVPGGPPRTNGKKGK